MTSDVISLNRDKKKKQLRPKITKTDQEMFRVAMEYSAIGMALVAPDGKWLKVNRAICNILGYAEEELLKIDFQKLTHPDDLDEDLNNIQKLLNDEIVTYEIEKRYYHKKGNLVWTLLTVTLVRDDKNNPLYFISQIQDFTQQRKDREKLELINSELQEFHASLSHDLRSPLRSSISLLELIDNTVQEENETSEKLKDYISLVASQLVKMADMVDEVLNIAQLGMHNESTTNIDPTTLIEAALEKFSYMDNFDRINFEIQSEDKIRLRTKKHPMRLIIDNLISNAIKYQDLSQNNSFIKITTIENKSRFILEIEDNGQGFKPEYAPRMFKMFQRFHGSGIAGSGLGLYMVRKSAIMLGGDIEFYPKESGSLFRVIIPITQS